MLELRPEVRAFAELMETQLRKHDATRGAAGWKTDHVLHLTGHLATELDEFWLAFAAFWAPPGAGAVLAGEAADVANMLMMVLDVLGVLPGPVVEEARP